MTLLEAVDEAAALEREYDATDHRRIFDELDYELEKLESMSRDWAQWNGTYNFMLGEFAERHEIDSCRTEDRRHAQTQTASRQPPADPTVHACDATWKMLSGWQSRSKHIRIGNWSHR